VLILLALVLTSALALYALTTRDQPKANEGASTPSIIVQAPQSGKTGHRDTLITDEHYIGPVDRGGQVEKFRRYVSLDLNTVDSLTLLRVPGIGPSFAHRILSLRQRLGGYYTVLQLQEVYGMNEEKFLELRPWFTIKTQPTVHRLSELRADSLPWHPYLRRETMRTLRQMVLRHGHKLSWRLLRSEGTFTRDDSIRLSPYFTDTLSPRDTLP
jgi:conserved domain protein